jgi:hypothetical protein
MYEYRELLLMRELILSLMLGLFVLCVVSIESWRRSKGTRAARNFIRQDNHRAVPRGPSGSCRLGHATIGRIHLRQGDPQ